jgi:hypothetical protein
LLIKNKKPELEILEKVDINDWQNKEKYYIKFYKNMGNNLVNSTDGGESFNMTDEIRNKISKNHYDSSIPIIQINTKGEYLKKYPSLRSASQSLKIKISNICKAAKNHNMKIGGYYWCYEKDYQNYVFNPIRKKSKRNMKGINGPFYGKKCSAEHKEKISLSNKKIYYNDNDIYNLYYVDKLKQKDIAKLYECSASTMCEIFKKIGIKKIPD